MTCLTVSQLLPIPKKFKPNTDCRKSNVLEIFSRWFISFASIGEHDIHPTSPSTFCYRVISVGFCILCGYIFVSGMRDMLFPRKERAMMTMRRVCYSGNINSHCERWDLMIAKLYPPCWRCVMVLLSLLSVIQDCTELTSAVSIQFISAIPKGKI